MFEITLKMKTVATMKNLSNNLNYSRQLNDSNINLIVDRNDKCINFAWFRLNDTSCKTGY